MNQWIDEYIENIKQFGEKKIFIYGAGSVGNIIGELCEKNDISYEGYVVTDLMKNPKEFRGKKVYDLEQIKDDYSLEQVLFLVAVMQRGEKGIEKYIQSQGGRFILSTPDDIMLMDEWESKRKKSAVMEITPSIGCSVNCHYCPQGMLLKAYFEHDKNRKKSLTFSEYKFLLDKMPKDIIIDFSGFVEPFLNEDAIEMMEYSCETGHDVSLYTTFKGLSYEGFQRLKKIPFKEVVLHTPDKYGYANIPMTDEYFKILREAIVTKKADGSMFIDSANCQCDPHEKIVELTKGKLKIYCEMSDRSGNLDEKDERLTHASHDGEIYCDVAYGINHNVLLPDGTVLLCCNDFGLKHVLGNLFESDYNEIVGGEAHRGIKRAMHLDLDKPLICRKCMFARECQKA